MTRRAPFLLLLLPLLAGCGDVPAAEALRRALPATAAPPAEAPPPLVEGPALLLEAPRRTVLRPVSGTGDRRVWRGEGGIALATEGARVVATAGLPRMLMATRFDGPDPLEDPRALLAGAATARRTLDLAGADRDPAGMRFGVILNCTLAGRMEGPWILVEERCTGSGLGFTNRFLADPATGAVLQSEQWAGEAVMLLLEMR